MAIIKHKFTYEERIAALKTMTWSQMVSESTDMISYVASSLSKSSYYAFKVLNICHKRPASPKEIPTLGVGVVGEGDIQLSFNPLFFLSLDLYEQEFVLHHEVLHVTFHHLTQFLPKDPTELKLHNYACDLAINSILQDSKTLSFPVHHETLKDKDGKVLCDDDGNPIAKKGDRMGLWPGMPCYKFDDYLTSANYLYLLKKRHKDSKIDEDCPLHGNPSDEDGDDESNSSGGAGENSPGDAGSHTQGGEGSGECADGDGGQGAPGDETGENGDSSDSSPGHDIDGSHTHGDSDQLCTCKNGGSGTGVPFPYNGLGDHSGWGQDNPQFDKADTKIRHAIEQAQKEKGDKCWGNLPGGSINAIKAAQQAEVAWERHLRHALGRYLTHQRKSCFYKPNRRGVDIHTYVGKKKKTQDKILVAIDTSGSVHDDELALFLAECNSLIMKGFVVDLMLFDHGLQWEKAKPFKKQRVTMDFEGRGGTEFSAPIKYAEEHGYKTLVMLTDGGAGDPGRPDYVDVLWVITPDGVKPPSWGLDRYVQMKEPITRARAA